MRALLLSTALFLPSAAHAECRPSPGGQFSYDTRLSPRAGRVCLYIADVHASAQCAQLAWSVELPCSQTERLVVSDCGALLSLLAPRASRPDATILRVTEGRQSVFVRLRELPLVAPLRGAVRLEFWAGRLRIRGRDRGEEWLTLAALEALVEARLHPPAPPEQRRALPDRTEPLRPPAGE